MAEREGKLLKNRSVPSPTITPVLAYPDVRAAVKWLTDVFGFTERLRIADHRSQMIFGDGAIIVAEYIDPDSRPSLSGANPDHVSHLIRVRVKDVQAHFEHVKASDAVILSEPTTRPYGEIDYEVRDIGGHRWTFAETIADIHPNEWGDESVVLSEL